MRHDLDDIDVSVVMAVKNEQVFVESAIQSICEQNAPRFELLVVDDGSTDETFSIVSRLCETYPQLRLVRNPTSGKCAAFNYGVSLSKGRFACLFAGDDLMPPHSLAIRWDAVKNLSDEEPGVGLCKLVTMSEVPRYDGHLIPRAPGRGALSGVSPLMNRLVLDKIFPVPESLPNEDTWMELAVLHFPDWNIVHSDVVGCSWRCHQGNSINMMSGFSEYNRKITARMRALALFNDKYGSELSTDSRHCLQGKIQCESSRSEGRMMGVLSSPVGLVDKLRALSITNNVMYEIRKRLYGLLSGR